MFFKLGGDVAVVAVVVIEAVEVAMRTAGCAKVRKDHGRFSLLLLWGSKRLRMVIRESRLKVIAARGRKVVVVLRRRAILILGGMTVLLVHHSGG